MPGKSRRRSRRAQAPADRNLGLRLLLLALSCAVASLATTALFLPAVGGAGLALKSVADHFDDLPADLTEPLLAQRTVLLDNSGREITQLHGPEDRVVVDDPDQIPDVMKKAIVAIEDSRFYEHHGVDFQGVVRALVRNGQDGGPTQGASTITQQYVKNVLEESAHTDAQRRAASADTTERKLQEARYALELERKYSKDEILLRYLNIANFGDGVYGVGTAVQHYFHTTLSHLTLPEAALLAGIVNSPTLFDPFEHPAAAKTRRNLVLDRMTALGFITTAQKAVAAAVGLPVRPHAGRAPADACENTVAPFFCFYVRNSLANDTALGDTQDERNHALYDGGLRIKTTLDMKVQNALQTAVDTILPPSNSTYAVIAAVEPGTGKVLGIAANRTYSSKKGIGNTKLGYLGYSTTFQGGSTFKLFTLAAALSDPTDFNIHTSFVAPACYHPTPASMYDPTGDKGPCPGGYQNSDPAEAGTYDMVSGTWYSVNTYFIQLEQKVGVQKVIDAAEAMGIHAGAFSDLGPRSLSVTLGAVNGVSPLEEATAYATIAAHGKECRPNPILGVTDTDDNPVPVSEHTSCRQVLDPQVADTIAGILEGVLNQPGATAAGKGLAGRQSAGKTGTLDEEKAAWFSGFTPQISASVVLGNPAATDTPLGSVADVNPAYVGTPEGASPLFGGTLPTDIWKMAMNQALTGVAAEPLPAQVFGAPIIPLGQVFAARPSAVPSTKGKPAKSSPKPQPGVHHQPRAGAAVPTPASSG